MRITKIALLKKRIELTELALSTEEINPEIEAQLKEVKEELKKYKHVK